MFRIGIRLCPPARIRASSPWPASSATASSVEATATYSKAGGFMRASRSCSGPGGSPRLRAGRWGVHEVDIGVVDAGERAIARAAIEERLAAACRAQPVPKRAGGGAVHLRLAVGAHEHHAVRLACGSDADFALQRIQRDQLRLALEWITPPAATGRLAADQCAGDLHGRRLVERAQHLAAEIHPLGHL